MTTLESLIRRLSRLPGIGPKSAARLAYYLLEADSGYVAGLAQDISQLKERIRRCSICGSFTESDPCAICTDATRERDLICVVERAQDVPALEASGAFAGVYHVLGGVISPIDGVGPNDLRVAQLLSRLQEGVREVIIATNPTVEGDTTALYVARLVREHGVTVSRLALGLPVGGDLEYVDRLTIERSLRGRTPLS
jgi:recombination protein RecR